MKCNKANFNDTMLCFLTIAISSSLSLFIHFLFLPSVDAAWSTKRDYPGSYRQHQCNCDFGLQWTSPLRFYHSSTRINRFLMFATSSDELKESLRRKRKRGEVEPVDVSDDDYDNEDDVDNINSDVKESDRDGGNDDIIGMDTLVKRLARTAAKVGEANRKREAERVRSLSKESAQRTKDNNNQSSPTKSGSARWIMGGRLLEDMDNIAEKGALSHSETNEVVGDDDEDSEKLLSLTELTKILDSELIKERSGGKASLDDPVGGINDSMTSLLRHNSSEGKWEKHYSDATRNVVIVFGKQLVRDQVTIEYASRIRALANMFKFEDFLPSLVCFCGGKGKGSQVSISDAGYVFFRHMCEAQDICLDDVEIFVDSSSENEGDAIVSVTNRVVQMLPRWLEVSPKVEDPTVTNRYGQPLPPRGLVNVHFTIVSTEYHLCNLHDIHVRSPSQSLLKPLEDLKEISKRPFYLPDPNAVFNTQSLSEYDASAISSLQRAVIKPSFSFQHATYPYIYSKDPATAYLGKCYILSQKLMPMRLNIKAVIDRKEFFQRDNFLALVSLRRSLVAKVEELHKPSAELSKVLRLSSNNLTVRKVRGLDTLAVDVVMEGALLALSRCIEIVRPAGLHISSVKSSDWVKALALIEYCMTEIRSICDPDRPLKPSEWGKLVDDEPSVSGKITHMSPPKEVEEWQEELREKIASKSKDIVSSAASDIPEETYQPIYNEINDIVDDLLYPDPPDEEKIDKFSVYDYDYGDNGEYDDDFNFDDDSEEDFPMYDENSVLISLDD